MAQTSVLPLVLPQAGPAGVWQQPGAPPVDVLEGLEFAKFQIAVRAQSDLRLPPFMGAEFREGFRSIFRSVACRTHGAHCRIDGPSHTICSYREIFGVPVAPRSAVMHEHEHAPQPFIISPPMPMGSMHFRAVEPIRLELVLVGRAISKFALFVETIERLGRQGIGTHGVRYKIESLAGATGESIAASPVLGSADFHKESTIGGTLSISFITPTRLVSHGRLMNQIPFGVLFSSLLRRIALLRQFHCGQDPDPSPVRKLIARADSVRTRSSSLRWQDWTRFCANRQTVAQLGGLVGSVAYEGELLPFLPSLRAGQFLNVGKVTSFGFGKYLLS